MKTKDKDKNRWHCGLSAPNDGAFGWGCDKMSRLAFCIDVLRHQSLEGWDGEYQEK